MVSLWGMLFAPIHATTVVFLGTGTPRLDPDRSGPSLAIIAEGNSYIVDAGPGVARRAAAAARKGFPELSPPNLTHVFITHLHSDHTLGYPDLIFSPWVVGRSEPLEAYGPTGLKKMTDHLEAAFSEDVQVRTQGLEQGNRTGYRVHVHEIQPGVVYKNGRVSVSAIRVHHGSWKEAFGFRFEIGNQIIVCSGDTAPSLELEKASMNADILIHEVYALDELAPENRPGGAQWPLYMKSFHTSSLELGALAARCHPKLLVLTHIVRRDTSDDALISEVRRGGFAGKVMIAEDLQAIEP